MDKVIDFLPAIIFILIPLVKFIVNGIHKSDTTKSVRPKPVEKDDSIQMKPSRRMSTSVEMGKGRMQNDYFSKKTRRDIADSDSAISRPKIDLKTFIDDRDNLKKAFIMSEVFNRKF